MLHKAIQVARGEWENLRCSLEMCGDIGDFNFEDIKNHRWLVGKEYESLISSLTEMDKKLSQYGYATPEAIVFERFRSRQDNPKLYEQDYIQFLQSIEMIWNEWEEMDK